MKVTLKPKEEHRILSGHLWVFSNEIASIEPEAVTGDLVTVHRSNGEQIGSGFLNRNSLIAVRLLGDTKVSDIHAYLRSAILSAASLRRDILFRGDACRLVFGESDGLPGLIIDRFNDSFVIQISSAGMERYKEFIASVLVEEFQAKNVITRHQMGLRRLEGLPESDEILKGEEATEEIFVNGIQYSVNLSSGQKTGFYFDQTDNRAYVQNLAAGRSVLDAFCNSGGFGLHAMKGGAVSVDFVDASEDELAQVEKNIQLNGFTAPHNLVHGDVFDFLFKVASTGKHYQMVMIDPPAFTKSRKDIPVALKAYEKLHRAAIHVAAPGSILVSSSCSFHIKNEPLLQAIDTAFRKSGRKYKILHTATAAPDHPVLAAMPETTYLKFFVFYIL
ncbi:Ribosomal RNA large subunit methyltransferase I [uncultured bacterium]|nr:Ribosomal RNA large subunit methyltransferase I [uncultured bacterium]